MRKAVILAAIAVALIVLIVPATAFATQVVERFNVAARAGVQSHADIDDGVVVFQQKDTLAGGWNIYGRTLTSSTIFPICTWGGDQILPRISGDLVVWEDHRGGTADIYGYDLANPGEFVICAALSQQKRPAVSGGWVVWQDHRNDNWDIFGWKAGDPAGGGPICAAAEGQLDPDVAGDWVVWTDQRWGDKDILGYNRAADYEFRVCTDTADQDQPATDGAVVVWRDARGAAATGADIYRFDLKTSTEKAVWTLAGDQQEPDVDGDVIVWSDGSAVASGRGFNVWGVDTVFDQPLAIATGARWQAQPAVDEYVVVWGDTAKSPAADLLGLEFTPWSARLRLASSTGSSTWTRSATIKLSPYGRSKDGIVTEMRLWKPGDVTSFEPYATTVDPWYLVGDDGVKRVNAQFRDLSGGVSPLVTGSITLDTHGPVCSVPSPVVVAAGDTATLKYRVNDNLSPKADVTIRIKNTAGATVAIMQLSGRATGKVLSLRYRCELDAGVYRVVVSAKDLAGNAQSRTGSNKLTVGE